MNGVILIQEPPHSIILQKLSSPIEVAVTDVNVIVKKNNAAFLIKYIKIDIASFVVPNFI